MNKILTPFPPYDLRHGRALRGNDTITYKKMQRRGAAYLVEFGNFGTWTNAFNALTEAFPDAQRLTGIGDMSAHQIVLNTEEELTFFKLIENRLKQQ